MSDEKGLSRDDLFIFMEWYKNTASVNTTILEQQKIILEKQTKLLDRVSNINSSLEKVSSGLETNNNNMAEVVDQLKKNNEALASFSVECTKHYNDIKAESTKEHNQITMKLYVSYGIMTTIIIGLIGLGTQLMSNLDLIDAIAKVVGAG